MLCCLYKLFWVLHILFANINDENDEKCTKATVILISEILKTTCLSCSLFCISWSDFSFTIICCFLCFPSLCHDYQITGNLWNNLNPQNNQTLVNFISHWNQDSWASCCNKSSIFSILYISIRILHLNLMLDLNL